MRFDLSDEEWALWEPLMPSSRKSGRVNDRRIMNAIFYVLRTGMPWRDLPEQYGPYTTAYNRFNRWSRRGIWKRIFDTLASKSRDNLYLIDSTIVKAHRSASGAKGGRKTRPSASAAAAGARKSTPSSTAKAVRSTSSWQADKSMTARSSKRCWTRPIRRSPSSPTRPTTARRCVSRSWTKRLARHSQPRQCHQESLLPQAHLSAPLQGRELLLPHQGLAANRHPVRQTRPKLP